MCTYRYYLWSLRLNICIAFSSIFVKPRSNVCCLIGENVCFFDVFSAKTYDHKNVSQDVLRLPTVLIVFRSKYLTGFETYPRKGSWSRRQHVRLVRNHEKCVSEGRSPRQGSPTTGSRGVWVLVRKDESWRTPSVHLYVCEIRGRVGRELGGSGPDGGGWLVGDDKSETRREWRRNAEDGRRRFLRQRRWKIHSCLDRPGDGYRGE